MKKTEMEGYILKNYYKLQSPSFFKFQYVFLDSEDYLADQLFIKYKVTVDFGDEYVKENSPYHVIFCKIRKRDEKKFLDALSEMYDKMLLMGYKDYQEVCDNFIRVVVIKYFICFSSMIFTSFFILPYFIHSLYQNLL